MRYFIKKRKLRNVALLPLVNEDSYSVLGLDFSKIIKQTVPAKIHINNSKYIASCGEIFVWHDGFSWNNRLEGLIRSFYIRRTEKRII